MLDCSIPISSYMTSTEHLIVVLDMKSSIHIDKNTNE